ncbi:MAG: protein translocase subunit SecF [Patescibacteria group bacterium]|nr:protein translocase subunit SecF [Patescibacteria group bacterium]
MYYIIQKRKIWLIFSSIMVAISIVFLAVWNLNFGIDFTGGSLLEVDYNNGQPTIDEVYQALGDLELESLTVQPVGETGMILRFQNISEEQHQEILTRLDRLRSSEEQADQANESLGINNSSSTDSDAQDEKIVLTNLEELRFDSVGPSIGKELRQKSLNAIFLVLAAIVAYVAWVFREVSKPVASWKFGITAIIALFHDVMITLGVFAILGEFLNIEINTAFVAAILTVLGYSVNDTIVVFDRIRENLPKSEEDFEGTVNTSVNQTITRSINTSLTTLLVLTSILIFGGATIKDFVLALSIGVFVGTYSSIFLASPLLVVWEKLTKK